MRGIEGKRMRGRFIVGYATGWTHQLAAEEFCAVFFHIVDHHDPFPLVHGRRYGFPQPFAVVPHLEFVYHNFYVMGFVAIYPQSVHQFGQLSVYPGIQESFPPELLEQLPVVSLPAFHHRGQHHDLPVPILLLYQTQDLIIRILYHFFTRDMGIGLRRPGKEQAQEIIDLRNGSHGGSRIAGG